MPHGYREGGSGHVSRVWSPADVGLNQTVIPTSCVTFGQVAFVLLSLSFFFCRMGGMVVLIR